MKSILRNILAVLIGIVVGGFVNITIITYSGSIIPPPEGTDMTTTEGLIAAADLLQPIHYLMPFLAHALGAFVGALIAGLIAATHKMTFALSIGLVFLIGGIMMVLSVPSPTWFIVVDLVLAYIPMAYFAGKMTTNKA
ncbi:hypothetical protein HNS38_14640 [Lentimicrobium sp. L6]|uniref:hypothetical protein n=1 Tax=Lentimicrobium sp. L6 TaxID=2735916 RepID=UPI001551EE54|nr:hypothetical protein [Lentimicrobium sp. L6]NPD86008.1 hypothetical protein [Lentimicrobium sp. L6]